MTKGTRNNASESMRGESTRSEPSVTTVGARLKGVDPNVERAALYSAPTASAETGGVTAARALGEKICQRIEVGATGKSL